MQTNTSAGSAVTTRKFEFHGCYASQQLGGTDCPSVVREILDDLVAPVIENLLEGNSGTILAYGQIGTGKTRLMNGNHDVEGLIEIAGGMVFESGLECAASYIEIYNDCAIDLLNQQRSSPRRHSSSSSSIGGSTTTSNSNSRIAAKVKNANIAATVLRIREHAIDGPYAEGKTTVLVSSVEALKTLLVSGDALRHTRQADRIPYPSSRSHAILTLSTTLAEGQRVSLNFVDLAGTGQGDAPIAFPSSPDDLVFGGLAPLSTPPVPSMASPNRRSNFRVGAATEKKMFATEATAISKSLATLSQVVHMLVKQSLGGGGAGGGGSSSSSGSARKQLHVPFRGSALTWLLKSAFGGASNNTVIIATISPAMQHCDETVATLRWAEQSMRIVAKLRAAVRVVRPTTAARPRSTPEPRAKLKPDPAWAGKFPPLSPSHSDPALRRRRHSTSSLSSSQVGIDGGRSSGSSVQAPLPYVSQRRRSTSALLLDHDMETIMSSPSPSPSPSPTENMSRKAVVPGSRRSRSLRKEHLPARAMWRATSPAPPHTHAIKAARGTLTHARGLANRMQRIFGNVANHRRRHQDADSDPEFDDDIAPRRAFNPQGPDVRAGRPVKYRPSGPRSGQGSHKPRRKSQVAILPAVEMPSVEKLFRMLPKMAEKPKPKRPKLNFAASYKRVVTESSKDSTDQIKYVSPKHSPEKVSSPPLPTPPRDDNSVTSRSIISDLERAMNMITAKEDIQLDTARPISVAATGAKAQSKHARRQPGGGSHIQPASPLGSSPRRRRSSGSEGLGLGGLHSRLPATSSPRRGQPVESQLHSAELHVAGCAEKACEHRGGGGTEALQRSSIHLPTSRNTHHEKWAGGPEEHRGELFEAGNVTVGQDDLMMNVAVADETGALYSSKTTQVLTAASTPSPAPTALSQLPTSAGSNLPIRALQNSSLSSSASKSAPSTRHVAVGADESIESGASVDDAAARSSGGVSGGFQDTRQPPTLISYTENTGFEEINEVSKRVTDHINDGHQRGTFLSATTATAVAMFADPSTVSFAKLGLRDAGMNNICAGSWFSMVVHLDLSENIIGDEACNIMAKVIKSDCWPVLATLNLDGGPLQPCVSDDGATAIVAALQKCSTLKTLSLRMNQLGEPVSGAIVGLVTATHSLQSLNLYANKLRDKGGLAVAGAVQNGGPVIDLDLSDNSFSEFGGLAVVNALASNKACCSIGLGWNYVGGELGNALRHLLDGNSRLTHLNIQWSNLGSGIAVLCEAVKRNTTLRVLDVSHNNLGPTGGILIAKALEENSSLAELNLLENVLDEDVAVALGSMLAVNTGLKSLNLSCNNLGSAGGEAIAAALAPASATVDSIAAPPATPTASPAATSTPFAETSEQTSMLVNGKKNTTLNVLGFAGVKNVTMASRIKLLLWESSRDPGNAAGCEKRLDIDQRDKIAIARSAAENDPKIANLDLESCMLTDADSMWLKMLLTFNTHIVDMNLNRNKLGKLVAAAVESALPANTTLQKLSLQSNRFEADAILSLQRARAAAQQSVQITFDAEAAAEPWA